MDRQDMIGHIADRMPLPALLDGLIEECAELQQGCAKLARAIRGENPTPVTPDAACAWIAEEMCDILIYMDVLARHGLIADANTDEKLTRWVNRLNGEYDDE